MSSNEPEIRWRAKDLRAFAVELPVDVIRSIEGVARYRDVSCEALVREYIGAALREDLSRYFSEQVLVATEDALTRRLPESDAANIMREIRTEFREHRLDRPRLRRSPHDEGRRAKAEGGELPFGSD
jgi:hypothetical protein